MFKSFFILTLFSPIFSLSQEVLEDSTMVRNIFNEALTNGECHENLKELCKGVGHRISGSNASYKAIAWGQNVLKRYSLDSIYLQEILVPHWVRGAKERLDFSSKEIKLYQSKCLAYGGSVGTNGVLTGNIVEVKSWDELDELGENKIKGKFVFYNRPMNPTRLSTFHAYGGCVDQRYWGAVRASKLGAIGVLVRSMTLKQDLNPHTGSMTYEGADLKIPSVAISTVDAHNLSEQLKKDKQTEAKMKLECKTLPDTVSYNVIAEIKGSEFPDKIIVVGGHLDSWDVGEGAHDDGAGIVQSIEVLKIFKNLGIQPKHTIRCILYMNEENGNRGGKTYAEMVKKKGEEHIFAIETDRGGFTPKGFTVDGTPEQLTSLQQFESLLEPYDLFFIKKGYSGVDIGPLKDGKICLVGLVPDSQRYFDFHHAPSDIFENVNKRELELGAASLASLIYLVDTHWD